MLADSLAATTGWLIFVALVGVVAAAPSWIAAWLRRGLPPEERSPARLERLAFGESPRVRRSPRHAVELHRVLLASGFLIALGLVLMVFMAGLRRLDVGALLVAILFVLPTGLVVLHARRRSSRS
jgi:hypothetical protein